MKTKTVQSLHDVYYLIILDYDDGPNYVVVPPSKIGANWTWKRSDYNGTIWKRSDYNGTIGHA